MNAFFNGVLKLCFARSPLTRRFFLHSVNQNEKNDDRANSGNNSNQRYIVHALFTSSGILFLSFALLDYMTDILEHGYYCWHYRCDRNVWKNEEH